MRTQKPICRFFNRSSGCAKGDACPFRHEAPLCRFFSLPNGCAKADACPFTHAGQEKETEKAGSKPVSKPNAGSDAATKEEPKKKEQKAGSKSVTKQKAGSDAATKEEPKKKEQKDGSKPVSKPNAGSDAATKKEPKKKEHKVGSKPISKPNAGSDAATKEEPKKKEHKVGSKPVSKPNAGSDAATKEEPKKEQKDGSKPVSKLNAGSDASQKKNGEVSKKVAQATLDTAARSKIPVGAQVSGLSMFVASKASELEKCTFPLARFSKRFSFELATCVSEHLVVLSCPRLKGSGLDVLPLLKLLAKGHPNLRILDLNGQSIVSPKMYKLERPEGAVLLGEAMVRCPRLSSLDVSNQALGKNKKNKKTRFNFLFFVLSRHGRKCDPVSCVLARGYCFASCSISRNARLAQGKRSRKNS